MKRSSAFIASHVVRAAFGLAHHAMRFFRRAKIRFDEKTVQLRTGDFGGDWSGMTLVTLPQSGSIIDLMRYYLNDM
jgi:hypothetical protein